VAGHPEGGGQGGQGPTTRSSRARSACTTTSYCTSHPRPCGAHELERVRAILCGAQAVRIAFGRGYGKEVFTWVEELFDYKNKLGVAAGCQAGMIKTRFNGSDYGTVVAPTYAVATA
jgi:hypothetical protein